MVKKETRGKLTKGWLRHLFIKARAALDNNVSPIMFRFESHMGLAYVGAQSGRLLLFILSVAKDEARQGEGLRGGFIDWGARRKAIKSSHKITIWR